MAIALALGFFAVAALLRVTTDICKEAKPGLPPGGPTLVEIKGSEMIVQGPIDDDLAIAVKKILLAPHPLVRTVLLSSFGGFETEAEEIKTVLSGLGDVRIVVPPNHPCESACILVALANASRFQPDDTATLMFHREWAILGKQCRRVCWFPNLVENIGRRHQAMQDWANRLAPGLGDKLAACNSNPFDTRGGITITGLAFKRFRSGDHDAVACPQF